MVSDFKFKYAFELWCWGRLLRVPWTARRSNQSILKEISPGCSLERLMKLQYFGHLMRRADSFEKDPDAGKGWGQEEKGMTEDDMVRWHHWLDGHGFEQTLGVGDGQGGLACCISWGCKESDTSEWLNWTELNPFWIDFLFDVRLGFNFIPLHSSFLQFFQHHLLKRLPILHSWHLCQGFESESESRSVVSDSLRPHRLYSRRRQRQPTPVLLPGKSHGQRSLMGCHLWGRRESDTTEVT